MFAMPMHQPGVQPRRIRQISGDSEFSEVFYDQAEVSADCRIGAEGEGWRVAMTILTAERGVGFAALALNEHTRLLGLLDHCARDDPAARGEAARLRDRVEVTRWQVMRAIERMGAQRDPTPSASIMKLVWSELTQDVIRTGFELDCAAAPRPLALPGTRCPVRHHRLGFLGDPAEHHRRASPRAPEVGKGQCTRN